MISGKDELEKVADEYTRRLFTQAAQHALSKRCPACEFKRFHEPEEWRIFHPSAGQGFTPESGWTSAAVAPSANGGA